jgi:hypothetical protein
LCINTYAGNLEASVGYFKIQVEQAETIRELRIATCIQRADGLINPATAALVAKVVETESAARAELMRLDPTASAAQVNPALLASAFPDTKAHISARLSADLTAHPVSDLPMQHTSLMGGSQDFAVAAETIVAAGLGSDLMRGHFVEGNICPA